jgi:para-nitrobenzyl esterase
MAQDSKACTARQLDQQWSKFAPVYAYQFEDRTAPSYFADVSFPMGAYHTAELQYLFPMFHGAQGAAQPLNAEQEKLSDTMVDYWTSFARSGEPRSSNVAAPWGPYAAATDNIQTLDLAGMKRRDHYGSENDCALWDDVLWFQ